MCGSETDAQGAADTREAACNPGARSLINPMKAAQIVSSGVVTGNSVVRSDVNGEN